MEKYYIPNPKSLKGFDKSTLEGLYKFGVIPQNIRVFANREHWAENSPIAPMDGTPKFWRDNAAVWSFDQDSFKHFYVSFDRVPVDFSHEIFQYYSPSATAFYRAYYTVGHLKHIPIIYWKSDSSGESKRLSFASGLPPTSVPVGQFLEDPTGPVEFDGVKYRSTFPSDCVLLFEGDEIIVVKIQDYIKEFPIKNISVAPGVDVYTDEEFVLIAENILKSQKITANQKRSEIKKIA